MASKNFSGVLRDPLGELANLDKIRFTHVSTTGETLRGSISYAEIGVSGTYDFNIEYGNVLIETKDRLSTRWINQGVTTINGDTTATTLPALLNALVPASDPLLIELESLLADAESAKSDAEAAAVTATDAAAAAAADSIGTNSLEQASGGKNKIFVDAQGNQNVMVWINKFNSEDVNQAILDRHGVDLQLGTGVFPAFIKNGVQIAGFWYGKYQASSGVGGGCSVIQGVKPTQLVDFDTAKSICTAKGAGWHLSSNLEWAAVALFGLAFGDQPKGNSDYGRAHNAKYQTMKRFNATVAPGDLASDEPDLVGTGPVTWSHDGTNFGVFDMVGNLSEWIDQIKLVDGQIVSTTDNNPDLAESSWTQQPCFLDSETPAGGTVVLNSSITNSGLSGSLLNRNAWRTTSSDPSYTSNQLMIRSLIEPASESVLSGDILSRNYGERMAYRGGHWNAGSISGIGSIYTISTRATAATNIGFRPALFEV